MSRLMKIGRFVFPSLLPVCCFSRGNGCAHRLTPKTLFRKHSFAFGGEIMTLRTAPFFTPRCVPSPLIFFAELTFAEIGSVLGISQNTAASRYRYALGALRKNFTPQ